MPVRDYESFLAPSGSSHLVQFYKDDSFLCEAAAGFLEGALLVGEPVVAIATFERLRRFRERLSDRNGAALRNGQVSMLDARTTLEALMVGDHPDPDRFDEHVGGIVRRALVEHPGARVRAFGEMVDLLCREGRTQAALELEALWNALLERYPLSLFCGYSIRSFTEAQSAESYAAVCGVHSCAFPPESLSAIDGTRSHLHALAELQERALSLELEAKQKKESDAFRLLVESVKDYAIFILNPNGIVTTWNAGAERIHGYKADEIIGRHFSCLFDSGAVSAGKCDRELEVASREGRCEDEGWRLGKDGSRFWANVVITALHSPTGQLVGYAKVTRDLTERRRAENERVRLAQIQEANRAKDDFFAMVSHELRAPLSAILGWSTLLRGKTDLNYIAKGLDTIHRNAKAQKDLIEDMLDMSRIVAGSMRVNPVPMDLASAARDVLDSMRPVADAKGVSLAAECFDDPVMLVGDPVRLKQMVSNLLSNAVKFTPTGGRVQLLLREKETHVELLVRDTGLGIDSAFLPYVFERFRQADCSTTRASGLGLGLAIVRHIVELHGGTIIAASDGVNRGATFSVTLPVQAFVTRESEPLDGSAGGPHLAPAESALAG